MKDCFNNIETISTNVDSRLFDMDSKIQTTLKFTDRVSIMKERIDNLEKFQTDFSNSTATAFRKVKSEANSAELRVQQRMTKAMDSLNELVPKMAVADGQILQFGETITMFHEKLCKFDKDLILLLDTKSNKNECEKFNTRF